MGQKGCGDCESNTNGGTCMGHTGEGFDPKREAGERDDSCFPASAMVETPSGKVAISNLDVGDLVISTSGGRPVARRITRKLCHSPTPLHKVVFESGGVVIATANHSFFTPNGWKRLGSLRKGDLIEQLDGTKWRAARIREIGPSGTMEPVFNLYTECEHNFVADGCIVHNFTFLRGIRTVLHNILFDDVPASWVDRLAKR